MQPFSPSELALLARARACLTAPVALRLTLSDDPRSASLREYAAALQAQIAMLEIRHERLDGDIPPALRIGRGLLFHAMPLGSELAPFLEALAGSHKPPALTPELSELAARIKTPVRLTLFVADACPFCPRATQALLPLAWASPMLQWAVADAALFADLAERAGVRAVPTLVLEGGLRWTQRFPLPEILSAAGSQDPARLGAETLEHLLAEGNAELLARMLLGHGRILPAFIDVLTHERWPVRLGAMVAVEYLMAENPALARQLIEPLQRRFEAAGDTVRGDMLCVMGQVGGVADLAWLERLGTRPLHAEVAEALHEACDEIRRQAQH